MKWELGGEFENQREEKERAIAEQNQLMKKKLWKGECHKLNKE